MSALEQPVLFPTEPVLTERQAFVYGLVRSAGPEGIRADEVGAALHARATRASGKARHDAGTRCEWCARDGRSVLTSKALRPLVKRRRGGGWVLRDPRQAQSAPSSQTEDLPF